MRHVIGQIGAERDQFRERAAGLLVIEKQADELQSGSVGAPPPDPPATARTGAAVVPGGLAEVASCGGQTGQLDIDVRILWRGFAQREERTVGLVKVALACERARERERIPLVAAIADCRAAEELRGGIEPSDRHRLLTAFECFGSVAQVRGPITRCDDARQKERRDRQCDQDGKAHDLTADHRADPESRWIRTGALRIGGLRFAGIT